MPRCAFVDGAMLRRSSSSRLPRRRPGRRARAPGADWITTFTSVAIYSVVAAGPRDPLRPGRHDLARPDRAARDRHAGSAPGSRTRRHSRSRCCSSSPARSRASSACSSGCRRCGSSGLYLALITLMFAGAVTVVLRRSTSRTAAAASPGARARSTSPGSSPVRRPAIATGDTAYYRYVVIVCALMFLLALAPRREQARPRLGVDPRERAGRARRRRQHHALQALGVRARVVHDRRRRAACSRPRSGSRRRESFQTQDSITLLATALIGGIFSLWGAVVAGVFYPARAVPLPGAVGDQPELPPHHLRRRPPAGAADRTRRARRSSCRRTSRTWGASSRRLPRRPAGSGGKAT